MTPSKDATWAVLAALPSGVVLTDQRGTIQFINAAAASMLKLEPERCVGALLRNLRGEYAAMLWPTQHGEILLLPDDSEPTTRMLGFTSRLVDLDRPDESGMVIVFSDITDLTERRRSDEHRRRLADLGALVATLAHEIRNPLAAITALARLLAQEDALIADPDARLVVDKILDECRRLTRLVEDVLGFARDRPIDRSPTDLEALLVTLVEDVALAAAGREHASLTPLTLEPIDPATLRIARAFPCDRDAMRQALGNLVRNAVQAVEAKGSDPSATAGVRIAMHIEDDGRLAITITDNGVGISSAELERVFEAFFSTRHAGTGLGLPVARRIAEQHGGQLSLQSRLGHGTVVTLKLGV